MFLVQIRRFLSLDHSRTMRLLAKSHWDIRVGLEIHAMLTNVESKLFSSSKYIFDSPPNSQVQLHDIAYPGSMPQLNRKAVEWSLVAALGLGCNINLISQFDRKHYFYADSPAGYQITQNLRPIAERGNLDYLWQDQQGTINLDSVRIAKIQLENDTGKSIHDNSSKLSYIEYNRSGVPLVEVVTECDFKNGAQALGFVQELQLLFRNLGVCRGRMTEGQMRIDCNVSATLLNGNEIPVKTGIRTEIKNVGSLNAVQQAIDYEIERHIGCYLRGMKVINETRSFDFQKQITISMRDKEVVQDYRFLPEPDLPLLKLRYKCPSCTPSISFNESNDLVCISCLKKTFLPSDSKATNVLRKSLVFEHGLSLLETTTLVRRPELYRLYIDTTNQLLKDLTQDQLVILRKDLQHTIRRELAFWIHGLINTEFHFISLPTVETFAIFVKFCLKGFIFGHGAVKTLKHILTAKSNYSTEEELRDYAVKNELWLLTDSAEISIACDNVISTEHKLISKYRKKPTKNNLNLLTMKVLQTNSKLNPHLVKSYFLSKLNK